MSWFRSSRRRRSPEAVEAPAGPPRPRRAELEDRPLADLHALAAEWGVPKYRLLRREGLLDAISGQARTEEPAVGGRQSAEEPAEPEPEAESDEEGVTGVLDLVGEGYGFLRVHGLGRSPDDPYVPRGLVEDHGLRRGDEVTGRVAPRRAGERHPRLVSIEGPAEARPPALDLDERPLRRPSRPLRAPAGPDAFGPRMVELVAPLARGQRVLVAGPPGSGATRLLRDLALGLAGPGSHVIVALVDVRPEEAPEWEVPEGLQVHAAPGDRPPREQVALAELALERGKRLAEDGADVVVVLDSISRLARAYGLARTRPGDDAPTAELLGVEGAKRWFAAARDTETGSLTLLATARADSESALEALVHETLLDAASAVVRLDPELAARGMHPAVDPRRSRALGEEAFVPEAQRRPLEALRGVMRSLEPVEGWEFAASRVRETASNDELLARPG